MITRNEMFLLGAGASVEAGVPAAFDLTKRIVNKFKDNPELKTYFSVVSFVLGGLLFDKGAHGEDPLSCGVNVEDFFNAVQMLADRDLLGATPFVGSWHAKIEEFDRIDPPYQDAARLQKILYDGIVEQVRRAVPLNPPSMAARNVDSKINDFARKLYDALKKGGASAPSLSSIGLGQEVGKLVKASLDDWAKKMKSSRLNGAAFRKEFERMLDQNPRPGNGEIYHEVSNQMIAMLVNFVQVLDPAMVSYLEPLVMRASGSNRVVIATLNYDNCIELASNASKVKCETGISKWAEERTFESSDDGILLLKLHGSIDWLSDEGKCDDRPMPHKVIRRASNEEMTEPSYSPAVIFGHRNKLTAEGPFLDLLRAFSRELEKVSLLTVIGYSFADPHINIFISQWLNTSSDNRLTIIDPGFPESPTGYRLDLVTNAANQVEIVRLGAGEAIDQRYSVKTTPR